MLYEIRETDAEGSISSEQLTASQTGDNFNKKAFSRSQPRTRPQKTCSNCIALEQELQKVSSILAQMKRVEGLLLNQVRDLKLQFEDSLKANSRCQKSLDEMNRELKACHDKLHNESMTNGAHSKQNMELKRNVLKLEEDLIVSSQLNQEMNQELQQITQVYNHEHKFVDSLLQMVMSCQPSSQSKQPPSLKQAWKWLKMILSDYMQLKQQSKRMHEFQESSGQSSSSTNK